MKSVNFYFDVISPYAWFAAHLLKRHKIEVNAVPVLFAGLLNHHGQLGPAEIPSKRVFTMKDVMRWAIVYGIKYKGPPSHPFNPLKALRMCVAAPSEKRFELVFRLMDLAWAEGKDLNDDPVLLDAAQQCSLDEKQLMEAIREPSVKKALKDSTEGAIAAGVFGVPTFVVEGELFFGHDRIEHLRQFLDGRLSLDSRLLEEVLARPRGADRK